jgi:hypothetical protein
MEKPFFNSFFKENKDTILKEDFINKDLLVLTREIKKKDKESELKNNNIHNLHIHNLQTEMNKAISKMITRWEKEKEFFIELHGQDLYDKIYGNNTTVYYENENEEEEDKENNNCDLEDLDWLD